jgi:cytochrome c-type biogenesis protein CcmH
VPEPGIADSNAGLAADLRREVHGMLLAGKSDAEILKFMTDRYGDFVLYRPPFVRRTLLLWLAPAPCSWSSARDCDPRRSGARDS